MLMISNAALGQCAVSSFKLIWAVHGDLLGTLGAMIWILWLALIGTAIKRACRTEWDHYWTQLYAAERVRAR